MGKHFNRWQLLKRASCNLEFYINYQVRYFSAIWGGCFRCSSSIVVRVRVSKEEKEEGSGCICDIRLSRVQ